MGLTAEEKAQLKRLRDKEREPDAPPVGRSVQAIVDFSNEKSVEAAIKHGFLTRAEAEEIKEGKDGDNDDDEDSDSKKSKRKPASTPRRRGYFPEG